MKKQIDIWAGELGKAAQKILFTAGRWTDLSRGQKVIVTCWIERSSAQYERMVALENIGDYMGKVTVSSIEHRFSGLLDRLGPDALSDKALRHSNRAVQGCRRQAVANMTARERKEPRRLIRRGLLVPMV